jgi:hypothetical protein
MGTPAVGKDIESICGKCGDVWHVVVAKVGEQVVKVQCKECGGVHRYRPLRPQKPPVAPRAPRPAAEERAAKERKVAADSRPPGAGRASRVTRVDGPLVTPDPLRPIRRYRPADTFAVGDAIEHVTFGRGVVEAAPEPGKIQVWFAGERKVLVHGRGASAVAAAEALPPRRPGGFE